MLKRLRKKHTHQNKHQLHRKHKKHFSKKWGIIILGVLLLGLAVVIPQLSQNQNLFGQAAVYDEDSEKLTQNLVRCRAKDGSRGFCVNRNNASGKRINNFTTACAPLGGKYFDPLYPGHYCEDDDKEDNQCCITWIKNTPACDKEGKKFGGRSGICEKVVQGQDRTYSSKRICPGPANIKCYLPPKRSTAPNNPSDLKTAYDSIKQKAGGNWSSKVVLVETNGNVKELISDNPTQEMEAVSVNKLAIAVAVLDRVNLEQELTVSVDDIFEYDNFDYSPDDTKSIEKFLEEMIVYSANTPVRVIQHVLNGQKINQILHDGDKKLYNTYLQCPNTTGLCFLGKTTPENMVNLLIRLKQEDSALLSPESSRLLLGWMENSRYKKSGHGVNRNMTSGKSYVKYGSWNDVRNEVGIYMLPGNKMVVYAFFTDGLNGANAEDSEHPVVKAHRELGTSIANLK